MYNDDELREELIEKLESISNEFYSDNKKGKNKNYKESR